MRRVALAEIGGRGGFVADARYAARPAAEAAEASDPLEDAYARGFADGERAAEVRAETQRAELAARLAAIDLAFARFDDDSAALLRERLRATVLQICSDMAGPVAIDEAGLARRVEAAAALLRRKHDDRVIHLHPEDLALVGDRLDPALVLVADPGLERGSLRIEGEAGGIEDGPQQWRNALSEALGGCTL